jgi:ubiquinone/menaquinone biosynthesis C-methylase UbiE
MKESAKRAEMPQGSAVVLDNRSLQKDYTTLLSVLKPGLRVLDVGCGTGAITQGISALVGTSGYVVGIDSSEHLIESGKLQFGHIPNLELIHANLFEYELVEKFDLVISARVLQWLSNPKDALIKFKSFLKPSGMISILDYNHEDLEWQPDPPASMQYFYRKFLDWRADAGMDNRIAENLPAYLHEDGLHSIEVLGADEFYERAAENFVSKADIWSKVAASRGKQMVQDGYITEEERLKTIKEYDKWVHTEAQSMTMKLSEVRGRL